jgi:hypothetical protein
MAEGQTGCNGCSQPLTDAELRSEGYGPRDTRICDRCRRSWRAQRRDGWAPVMQWEEAEGLRLASTAPIPWDSPRVALIRITKAGEIHAAHSWNGKLQLMEAAAASDVLLVTWPGKYRQDTFIVDNRKALRAAVTPQRRR